MRVGNFCASLNHARLVGIKRAAVHHASVLHAEDIIISANSCDAPALQTEVAPSIDYSSGYKETGAKNRNVENIHVY